MPTYEYECDACEHKFEEFQSMSRQAAEEVPQVQEAEAAPAVRHRGGDHLQGLGLLPDRLPQRIVQERRQGRRAQGGCAEGRHRKSDGAKTDAAKTETAGTDTGGTSGGKSGGEKLQVQKLS